MFVLKKIITSLLMPQGLIIVLLLAVAIFMKKRLRIFTVVLAALIYVLSIGPTAELFIRPLENAYEPASLGEVKTCDAYVVLGAGANENTPDMHGKGTLGAHSLPRIITAYRLYMVAQKPIILATGREFDRKTEAEIARKLLLSFGVPENRIITETESVDTYESAWNVKEIADKYQLKKIALITSAFHMKRSYMLFNKHFRQIVPYPTDYQISRSGHGVLSFLPKASNLYLIDMAVKEYLGIIFYKLTLH